MTRQRDDTGSITALTASVLGGFVLLAVLVTAGSAVLRARSEAFGLAASAARAGAQELDDDALMDGTVELDPSAAVATAETYLSAHGAAGTAAVVGGDVVVTVTDAVDIPQLGQVVSVSSTATVSARRGTPTP